MIYIMYQVEKMYLRYNSSVYILKMFYRFNVDYAYTSSFLILTHLELFKQQKCASIVF